MPEIHTGEKKHGKPSNNAKKQWNTTNSKQVAVTSCQVSSNSKLYPFPLTTMFDAKLIIQFLNYKLLYLNLNNRAKTTAKALISAKYSEHINNANKKTLK